MTLPTNTSTTYNYSAGPGAQQKYSFKPVRANSAQSMVNKPYYKISFRLINGRNRSLSTSWTSPMTHSNSAVSQGFDYISLQNGSAGSSSAKLGANDILQYKLYLYSTSSTSSCYQSSSGWINHGFVRASNSVTSYYEPTAVNSISIAPQKVVSTKLANLYMEGDQLNVTATGSDCDKAQIKANGGG